MNLDFNKHLGLWLQPLSDKRRDEVLTDIGRVQQRNGIKSRKIAESYEQLSAEVSVKVDLLTELQLLDLTSGRSRPIWESDIEDSDVRSGSLKLTPEEEDRRELPLLITRITSSYLEFNSDCDSNSVEINLSDYESTVEDSDYKNDNNKFKEKVHLVTTENTIEKCTGEDRFSGKIKNALEDNKKLESSHKIEDTIIPTNSNNRIIKETENQISVSKKEDDLNILKEKKEHQYLKENSDDDKSNEKLKNSNQYQSSNKIEKIKNKPLENCNFVKKRKEERRSSKEPTRKKRRISKDKTVVGHSNEEDALTGHCTDIGNNSKMSGNNEIAHDKMDKKTYDTGNDKNYKLEATIGELLHGKVGSSFTVKLNVDNSQENQTNVTLDPVSVNKCNQQLIGTCVTESPTSKESGTVIIGPQHEKCTTNGSKPLTSGILDRPKISEELSDSISGNNCNEQVPLASKGSKVTKKYAPQSLNKIVTDLANNDKLPVIYNVVSTNKDSKQIENHHSNKAHNDNENTDSSKGTESRVVKPLTKNVYGDTCLTANKDNGTSKNSSQNLQEVHNDTDNTSVCNEVTQVKMVGFTDKSDYGGKLKIKDLSTLEPNKISNMSNENIKEAVGNDNNDISMNKDMKDPLVAALHKTSQAIVHKKNLANKMQIKIIKENIEKRLRSSSSESYSANHTLEQENKLIVPVKENSANVSGCTNKFDLNVKKNSASSTSSNSEIKSMGVNKNSEAETLLKDAVKIKELDCLNKIKCKEISVINNELSNPVCTSSVTKQIMSENDINLSSNNHKLKETVSTDICTASKKGDDAGNAIEIETECELEVDINELNKNNVFCKNLPLIGKPKKNIVKSNSSNNHSKIKNVKEPNSDKAANHINSETMRKFVHELKSLKKQVVSARKRSAELPVPEVNRESKVGKTLSCIQKSRPEITIKSVSQNLSKQGSSSQLESFTTSPTSNDKHLPDSSQSCNSAQQSVKIRTDRPVSSRSITSKSLTQTIDNLVSRRNSANADAVPMNNLNSNISGNNSLVNRRNSACADSAPINSQNLNILDNNNLVGKTYPSPSELSLKNNQNSSVTRNNLVGNALINLLTTREDISQVKSLGLNTNVSQNNLKLDTVSGSLGETSLVRHQFGESSKNNSSLQSCGSMEISQNIMNMQNQQQVNLPVPVRNLINNAVDLVLHFFYKPDIHTSGNFIPREIHHDILQFLLSEGRPIECASVPEIIKLYLIFYTIRFGESTNAKISKLAELLHLAIADLNRRNERNHRALRLTSEVLRKEEMNRAECDYREMLSLRGMKFGEIFRSLSCRFIGCEYSMVATLYFRIIQALLNIDKENCNYILRIRGLCKSLLEKCSFELSNTCKTFFDLTFETVTTNYVFVKQCLMSFYILGYKDAGTSEVLLFSEITPCPINVWQLEQQATNLGFETLNVGSNLSNRIGNSDPQLRNQSLSDQQQPIFQSLRNSSHLASSMTETPSSIQSTSQVTNQQSFLPLQEQNRTQSETQEIQTYQQKVQRQQMLRAAAQQQALVRQRLQGHQSFSNATQQQKMQNPTSIQSNATSSQQQQNCQSTQLSNVQALYNHLSLRQKQQNTLRNQTTAGTSPQRGLQQPSSVQLPKPAETAVIGKPPNHFNITPQLKQEVWMQYIMQNKHLVAGLAGNTTSRPTNTQYPLENPRHTSSKPTNVMIPPNGRHSEVAENTPSTSQRRDSNESNASALFMEGMEGRQCERPGCTQIATVVCSLCKGRFYCRRECQSQDWYDGHSKICLE